MNQRFKKNTDISKKKSVFEFNFYFSQLLAFKTVNSTVYLKEMYMQMNLRERKCQSFYDEADSL